MVGVGSNVEAAELFNFIKSLGETLNWVWSRRISEIDGVLGRASVVVGFSRSLSAAANPA